MTETTALPLSETLPGTWQLVSRIDVTSDGARLEDPLLGSEPEGLLIYDRAGNFAAQFMRKDRTTLATDVASPAPSNNTRAIGGYDAYFGTYTVDDESGAVTQRLVGSLSPPNVGQVVTRTLRVVGDELVVELDTESADGVPITRTLRWRRVG